MLIRNFTEAFRIAGYDLKSPRNQWSAISEDGKRVAVTVWSDEIDKTKNPWEVDLRGHPRLHIWISKAGNSTRTKHVRHALDFCSGKVDLILCKAVDTKANTRSVEWARPWTERYGLIVPENFNEQTGEYRMLLPAR